MALWLIIEFWGICLNSTVRDYFVLFVIFALAGFFLFWTAAAPPSENPPKGPIEIGVGPGQDVNINKTELYVYVSQNSIDVRVTFRFNKIQKYFIYAMFPYTISNATEYCIYNSALYPNPSFHIGDFSRNFMNTNSGFSIVNATLDLNATFPFNFVGPDLAAELTLGVHVEFQDSLVAIDYPLRTSQVVVLTFFGERGFMPHEMYAFKEPMGKVTIDRSFIVHLMIPSDTYFSEGQPTPIQYYIKEGNRWVMFSLNFLEGRYAQTLFCSFANPTRQAIKQVLIFVGGIFVSVATSFMVLIVRYYKEKKETEPHQQGEC